MNFDNIQVTIKVISGLNGLDGLHTCQARLPALPHAPHILAPLPYASPARPGPALALAPLCQSMLPKQSRRTTASSGNDVRKKKIHELSRLIRIIFYFCPENTWPSALMWYIAYQERFFLERTPSYIPAFRKIWCHVKTTKFMHKPLSTTRTRDFRPVSSRTTNWSNKPSSHIAWLKIHFKPPPKYGEMWLDR